MPNLTRRRLLGAAGGGALGIAAGGGFALGRTTDDEAVAATTFPFYGERQAGITTPSQDRLAFGALDLTLTSAADLRDLLRTWTTAAERMTRGVPAGDPGNEPLAPPEDTGEALDLHAARLTITIGFGPGVFERDGEDRFGLASRRPQALRELPALPGEDLEAERSGGDLCVQACADDPQVAFHAVRNLTRLARGAATLRWTQLGFGRTSSVTSSQETMRNLQGFKDGTKNLKGDDDDAMRKHVIVGAGEPQRWMHGGSYMVTRRIRMLIEAWDRTTLDDQELTIGRRKLSGSPLTGTKEHDALDFKARGADGKPAMPLNAHVRLAAPETNGGVAILRRGYSYTDGIDAASGQLDAGLFFIAFQRDPRQFIELQRRLGATDALNEYIRHTGSAVFAVPPGAVRGGYVGDGLLRA
ncbi:MAG TPA: iron uptake transporter deferrochelatase/peroxidase subunit [Solirubrobacteraceae bacterium]|nr:iron uptake transporter deferrochelatase/peroxidase subunit [Solirubrobacteraceae bacterium]